MLNKISLVLGVAAIVSLLFAVTAGATPTPTVMPAYEPPVRTISQMMDKLYTAPVILCGSTRVTPVFGPDGSLSFEQKPVDAVLCPVDTHHHG